MAPLQLSTSLVSLLPLTFLTTMLVILHACLHPDPCSTLLIVPLCPWEADSLLWTLLPRVPVLGSLLGQAKGRLG
jgi:hypothetical protein